MKKRLIFEVEEGVIHCDNCPFGVGLGVIDGRVQYSCKDAETYFDCNKYDLSTLKLIGEEHDRL